MYQQANAMEGTKSPDSVGSRRKKFKRTVRGALPNRAVTIEEILAQGNARERFEELVNKGIPNDLLKEALVSYANGSDEKIELIPGMSRKRVRTFAKHVCDLAESIEGANESPFTSPRLTAPPSPWPGKPFCPIFLELPVYLKAYALHLCIWLDKPPQTLFDSHRQHLEIALVAISIHFTNEEHYAAIADLLTAALYALDEQSHSRLRPSKPADRHALAALVKDHPEDMNLAKENIL